MRIQVGRNVGTIISLAVLGILWWTASNFLVTNTNLFPGPVRVADALVGLFQDGPFGYDIWVTFRRVVLGFALGSLLAVIMAGMTGRIRTVNSTLGQVFQLLRPLTPVALGPFFILWIGINETSKVLLIAWGVFFPVWIASHLGMRDVKSVHIWSAKTLGYGRLRMWFDVIIHSALPLIVSGLRTGIAVAYILLYVSETLGASYGVGYRLSVSYDVFHISQMMACLFTLGVMGALSDQLFAWGVRTFAPWMEAERTLL